tara:strand:+ start:236 stop:484 length:249 start_codon:yes stop_codon:yes gene_type:complete
MMNVYMLVNVQAYNFIEDKHKLCYINKGNAESIQKTMKDKYDTELRLVEIELMDTGTLEVTENLNINDDKYGWNKNDFKATT